LRTLAFIYLAMALVAAAFIRLPKQVAGAPTPAAGRSLTIVQALQTRAFWLMWLAIAMSAQGSLYVSAKYKTIALDFPELRGDRFLATVGSLGSLSNGFSRLAWGILYDRIGFKKCMTVITSMQVLLFLMFTSLTSSPFMYICGVVLSFACLGGNFALAPVETYKLFGNAAVFGMMFTAFAFAGLFGGKIASGIADFMSPDQLSDGTPNTEETSFRFLSFVSLIALVLVQFHGRPCDHPAVVPEVDSPCHMRSRASS